MTNKFGLSEETVGKIYEYFRQNKDIKKVMLYGSRAKGTFSVGSDIDFAIWADSLISTAKIQDDLNELSTPYHFDVINYQNITNKNLQKSIDNSGIIFYEHRNPNQ